MSPYVCCMFSNQSVFELFVSAKSSCFSFVFPAQKNSSPYLHVCSFLPRWPFLRSVAVHMVSVLPAMECVDHTLFSLQSWTILYIQVFISNRLAGFLAFEKRLFALDGLALISWPFPLAGGVFVNLVSWEILQLFALDIKLGKPLLDTYYFAVCGHTIKVPTALE